MPALAVVVKGNIDDLRAKMAEGTAEIQRIDAAAQKVTASVVPMTSGLSDTEQKLRALRPATTDVVTGTDALKTSLGEMVAGFALGMLTLEGAKLAFGALSGFVRDSIAAAADAEVIQTKLAAALRNTHQDVAATSAQYQAYAQYLQATTTLEDDAVLKVIALATEMGVHADQMRRVITVSADLSAAWGISLEEAMAAVVKGGEGITKTFKAHAIELDDARVKVEGLTYVLPELEQHFNGNAAAQLGTYTGRVTALGVAWGNLKEEIGSLITQGGHLTGGLGTASAMVLGLSTVIKEHGVTGLLALAASGTNVVNVLGDIGRAAQESATHLKRTGDISLDVVDTTKDLTAWIASLRTAVESLTPQQQRWIEQAKALGASETEIAAHLKVSDDAVKAYIDSVTKRGVAAKATAEEEIRAQKQILAQLQELRKAENEHGVALLKEAALGYEAIKKADDAFRDATAKNVLSSTEYQKFKIWEVANAEIAAMKGTDEQRAEFASRRKAAAEEEVQALTIDTAFLKANSTEYFKDQLEKAKATYQAMLDHASNYSYGTIEAYKKVVDAAKIAAGEQVTAANSAAEALERNIRLIMAGLAPLALPGGPSGPPPGWGTDRDTNPGAWGAGPTYRGLGPTPGGRPAYELPPGGFFHYADGVQHAPGGWATVGERGPETMYVPPGATIYPNGSSVGGDTIVHVHVDGHVIGTQYELARLIKQALVDDARSLGRVL